MGPLHACVAGTAVTMLVAVAVEAHARRTEVSGRTAKFCSVWIKQKFDRSVTDCFKQNGLTSSYHYSLRVTMIAGYEDDLDPNPVRRGVLNCLGADAGAALEEDANRDAGGHMVFGKIECSMKYINYMEHHDGHRY